MFDIWSQALSTSKNHYGYYANILGCSKKPMQFLSVRSKVSSKGFYESFTSNKQCNLYVCDKVAVSFLVSLT